MIAIRAAAAMPRVRPAFLIFLFSLLATLGGCASRPAASVLDPVSLARGTAGDAAASGGKALTLFAVTNRERDGDGFDSGRARALTYERYRLSIPAAHKPAAIEYPSKKADPTRAMTVRERRALDQRSMVAAIISQPGFDGTIGLFVHGFNYRYQEGVFRLAQMAVDSRSKATPVLFSWPSEGALSGYLADRDAVLFSRDDLVSLMAALAETRKVRQILVFGHSMGGFLIMESLRQLRLTDRGDVLDKLTVILAAPDIDADLFRRQMDVVGRLRSPLVLLVSPKDEALAASSLLSGSRPRVGRLDVEDPKVRETAKAYGVLVVDITSLNAPDGLGHDRYASLAALAPQVSALGRPGAATPGDVGAFILDAAGQVVASPFTVAGRILAPK
ncbi:alpha/beta fold hydrolase [Rhizobiaceae bacterium CRRU44]|uniref:Alpha/beta fold hydrolase n=1 Tax=Ferranicluibacter rubi TaxID=2715133 RepID=A0AA44CCP2_9HYPH|nr:alpha/beta fold hydrolase [Ferranicluibacter rubi]NHT78064.1 alpha/beta fold hydrolase [Ferranicluibacter rubi]